MAERGLQVYKFGGASVRDAQGVKNVGKVLSMRDPGGCVVVVSAMGKTTNALESAVAAYFSGGDYTAQISAVKAAHLDVANGLFDAGHLVFGEIEHYFEDIGAFLSRNKSPDYNFVYDQVVGCGELISSKILSAYLNVLGTENLWLDARDYIRTDRNYREANVDWAKTQRAVQDLSPQGCYVTQGFIGSDENHFTVTLGREGSDYSAAIFAYCLGAQAMTIWKDVPGVMTGDPRKFPDVALLPNISYEEAIEMAYYGASVIHPKTLQPLKQKNIPFYVKSFLEPEKQGTKVGVSEKNVCAESYILKEGQTLLHVSTKDFSFIAEDHLSRIFGLLDGFKIKISLMQNSAISLALCLEDKFGNMEALSGALAEDFKTEAVPGVTLFTVRHAGEGVAERFLGGKKVLLEQLSRRTLQIVYE